MTRKRKDEASDLGSLVRRVAELHRKRYHEVPRIAVAPGRVNLIGEHTDYQGGFVLPATIDRHVVVAFSHEDDGDDGTLRGYAVELDDEQRLPLSRLSPSQSSGHWFDFPAGVVWALQKTGARPRGMRFVVGGDLPIGAGLSSSAALGLAVARAAIADGPWDARAMARVAHRAENEYVGMPCGIMDPFVIALGDEGSALLIDCRNETEEKIALPQSLRIVVMDTGTRRPLLSSDYQERRRRCEEAAKAVGAPSLREASWESIERTRLDETTKQRARHVIEENERTLRFAEALAAGELRAMSELLAGSHESLRDRFEVSTPELDAMVAIAREQPGVVGARMTGAGFGGSAVALAEAAKAAECAREIERTYRERTGKPGRVFVCRTAPPARLYEHEGGKKRAPRARRRS